MNRLLRYLFLGVVEGDPDPDPDPNDKAETGDGADDLFQDDLIDAAESGGGKPEVKEEETPALKEAKRRADEAEARANDERSRREALERAAPAPTPQRDPEFDREEAELRQAREGGSTPEQIAWLQWKIDSNRKMRSSERNAGTALQEARDLADRTAFERLEITHPKVYQHYASRVDAAVADMRAKGQQVPPRAAILRLMIGDDLLAGKVAPKKKAAPVERGRTPGVRSDVRGNGKGAMTEHEKRKQRLANVRI